MDAEDAIEAGWPPDGSVEASAEPDESGEPEASGEAVVSARSGEEQGEFEPLAVPELEPTGHAAVDAALDRLRELGELPTGAHSDLYDGVHQRLQDALAQIDQQDAGR